ncbi:MAG: GNAT family N-acetyltransferase [Anaerolineae bacterium]|nr:GNAT family N-acetyltransferase [Anaerolineae bacterium]
MVFEISPPLTNDQLNALFDSAWEHHRPRDFQPILRHSLLYIGAFQGQQLVGFVNVAWDGGIHAFVLDTTVHQQYQRRGIGQRLMQTAIDAARTRHIEWLHVDYEPQLTLFYAKCGFQDTAAGLLNLLDGNRST